MKLYMYNYKQHSGESVELFYEVIGIILKNIGVWDIGFWYTLILLYNYNQAGIKLDLFSCLFLQFFLWWECIIQ
jgi:hypothetical protein